MSGLTVSVTELAAFCCPLCFWLQLRGLAPPELHPPAILSRMDSIVKQFMKRFIGISRLPEWFPVKGTFLGEPELLEVRDEESGVTLRGRPDALVLDDTGLYHIVDYKTARARPWVPEYYQLQLDAYAWLLERKGYRVGKCFLLYIMPASMEPSGNSLKIKAEAVEVQMNPKRIPQLLRELKRIADMQNPPEAARGCGWCEWRERVQKELIR
jgi:CRISPR/Cas system-associated exonuclease Cas4 (RecB family)